MFKMMFLSFISIVLLNANESKQLALKARIMWSSFECSNYASGKGDKEEANRLFSVGYKEGKTFLDALQSKKIKKEDISTNVPIGLSFKLWGPSSDFVIGRLYEDLYTQSLYLFKDETGKSISAKKYNESNCKLIGY